MPRRGGDGASPAKLANYRAKRDFEKTAEPGGETAVTPSPQRRFVIQKHAATGGCTTICASNWTASSSPGR